MAEFRMPSLGADMDVGIVAEWRVKPGDHVRRGDIVAVVETEKSTIEVEIFETGVIEEILVHEGEEVPVGAVLARVRADAPAGEHPRPPTVAPSPPEEPHEAPAEPVGRGAPAALAPGIVLSPVVRQLARREHVDLTAVHGTGPGGAVTRSDVEHAAAGPDGGAGAVAEASGGVRVRSSPMARRLAAERGLDLGSVRGTGPGGAVVERDVVAHAHPAARQGRGRSMRAAIGALMARSKREIPHYYLSTTIDLARATAWMTEANATRAVTSRLVMPVLLLKATALAVAEVPEMNGFMEGEEFVASTDVHLGVAVSLRTGGLVAPAIHDAQRLSVDELMASLRDLVSRARRGVLRSSEMSDPTITVSNLGELGVDSVFGVIYPPQVALVGFGRVAERPWAADGLVGARWCVTATLSADHRASDGHRGGRFLAAIDRLLQSPEEL